MDLRPVPSPFMTLKKVTNFWISYFHHQQNVTNNTAFCYLTRLLKESSDWNYTLKSIREKCKYKIMWFLKVQRSFIYRPFFSCLEKESAFLFFFLKNVIWGIISFLEDTKQQNNSFIFSADTNSFWLSDPAESTKVYQLHDNLQNRNQIFASMVFLFCFVLK